MRHTIILIGLIATSFALKAGGPEESGGKSMPIMNSSMSSAASNMIAPTADSKRWKYGFIVTVKGDTQVGKIKTMDFLDVNYDYQRAVAFKDAKGITQYSPNDLKMFSYYENQDKLVTLQAVSSPDGDGRAFLKLYQGGTCKVYGMTKNEVKADADAPEGALQQSLIAKEKKYIQVKNSQFYPLKRAGFKKNMKEVFAKCPRIVEGLESNRYTYDKWEALVKDYNQQYK